MGWLVGADLVDPLMLIESRWVLVAIISLKLAVIPLVL